MSDVRRKILVVEDEALVADMLAQILDGAGMDVIGPIGTITGALQIASDEMDAAFLDVNLRGERIDPVADILKSRGIPIIFTTGYGQSLGPLGEGATILTKPYTDARVLDALTRIFDAPA